MKLLIPSTATPTNAVGLTSRAHGKLAGRNLSVSDVKRQTSPIEPDSETYQREYRNAVIALEAEQHQFLGILDAVKSFFLWFETPEQRMLKNGYVAIDSMGNGLPEKAMSDSGNIRKF